MTANIVLAILVTSLATYISRFLGALTSEKIGETSKIYKWFNCVAYSTLAALIFSSAVMRYLESRPQHSTLAGLICLSAVVCRLFVMN